MLSPLAGALALAALPSALAFRDTSPFFLFSTASLNVPSSQQPLALSSQVTDDVLEALHPCATRSYIIVEQDGVSASDFTSRFRAPGLTKHMSGEQPSIKTAFSVPEVAGRIKSATIADYLVKKCGWERQVHVLTAPRTTVADRTSDLITADDTLFNLISTTAHSENYTVIYITSPLSAQDAAQLAREKVGDEHPPYEMESPFGESQQMELKRDLSSHVQRANSTNDAGLFERYQYFTPGLFMGFGAIIPLFLILMVGVRALTSLEVSYFAFSKEMGPNAQRKQ